MVGLHGSKSLSSIRIFEYKHFPAIEYKYDDAVMRTISPTFRWIGDLILQVVTTLTSAYAVFNVIISRLVINKIKVYIFTAIIEFKFESEPGFHQYPNFYSNQFQDVFTCRLRYFAVPNSCTQNFRNLMNPAIIQVFISILRQPEDLPRFLTCLDFV